MALSIFDDKERMPDEAALTRALGKARARWDRLCAFVRAEVPGIEELWSISGGAKAGWGFRLKDKKRVVLYLIPGERTFKAGIVLGAKATDAALASAIPDSIKDAIRAAPVYAEGRGFRIDVDSVATVAALETLIRVKLAK